jgi:serine/threonine protein kinase
MFTKSLA